jgi:hypothetical protein
MIPWDKLHGAITHFLIHNIFQMKTLQRFPDCPAAVFNGLRFRIHHIEEAAVCERVAVSQPLRSRYCRPGFFGSSDLWHCS